MEPRFRCDHCGASKPLADLTEIPTGETKQVYCSVRCYLQITVLANEERCLRVNGGHSPSSAKDFWFRDPEGIDHFRTRCSECDALVGDHALHPERTRCSTRHATLLKEWEALRIGWEAPLQKVDGFKKWSCGDCGWEFSRGALECLTYARDACAGDGDESL